MDWSAGLGVEGVVVGKLGLEIVEHRPECLELQVAYLGIEARGQIRFGEVRDAC